MPDSLYSQAKIYFLTGFHSTITTTSGTASEINPYGVISNPETQEKIGFGFPEPDPVLAIVDPELMTSVPPKYTAYQGFDALFHNTEVMISKDLNIMTETLVHHYINGSEYQCLMCQGKAEEGVYVRQGYSSVPASATDTALRRMINDRIQSHQENGIKTELHCIQQSLFIFCY